MLHHRHVTPTKGELPCCTTPQAARHSCKIGPCFILVMLPLRGPNLLPSPPQGQQRTLVIVADHATPSAVDNAKKRWGLVPTKYSWVIDCVSACWRIRVKACMAAHWEQRLLCLSMFHVDCWYQQGSHRVLCSPTAHAPWARAAMGPSLWINEGGQAVLACVPWLIWTNNVD